MFKIWKTLELLFSTKMLIIRAGIHKMIVRILSNRENPNQQSDLGLHSLSMPFDRKQVFKILEHLPFNCKS